MKIITDTNFLVDSIRWKVVIFSELKGNEIYVLTSVLKELKRISESRKKESALAKTALSLVKSKGLKTLKPIEKQTDLSLLSYAWRGYAIATHDKILKDLIIKRGGKVILIRQRKYVEVE